MGWSSANGIFDPIAAALVEEGCSDALKTNVLGILIGVLRDGDWDTADESLGEFADDPAVVAAFRTHGIVIRCQAESPCGRDSCDLEVGHAEHEHADDNGARWNAGTEQLMRRVAETLRAAGLPERRGPSPWETVEAGFAVTTGTYPDAVNADYFEPRPASGSYYGPQLHEGRVVTAWEKEQFELNARHERARAAREQYLQALTDAGWVVEYHTDEPFPFVRVRSRSQSSDNELV